MFVKGPNEELIIKLAGVKLPSIEQGSGGDRDILIHWRALVLRNDSAQLNQNKCNSTDGPLSNDDTAPLASQTANKANEADGHGVSCITSEVLSGDVPLLNQRFVPLGQIEATSEMMARGMRPRRNSAESYMQSVAPRPWLIAANYARQCRTGGTRLAHRHH